MGSIFSGNRWGNQVAVLTTPNPKPHGAASLMCRRPVEPVRQVEILVKHRFFTSAILLVASVFGRKQHINLLV